MSTFSPFISRACLGVAFAGSWLLAGQPFADAAAPATKAGTAASATTQATKDIPVLLIGGQNNHDWKLSNQFLSVLLAKRFAMAVTESNTPPEKSPAAAWATWNPQFEKYRC